MGPDVDFDQPAHVRCLLLDHLLAQGLKGAGAVLDGGVSQSDTALQAVAAHGRDVTEGEEADHGKGDHRQGEKDREDPHRQAERRPQRLERSRLLSFYGPSGC